MLLKDIRTEMPPLLRLALPLILGELGWIAMSVVDTVMVGRLPDSAIAMSAAALAQVLFNTFVWGFGGVLLGLDTLISQAFGAKEVDEANRWLVHGLVMAAGLSAVLIGLFVTGPLALRHLPVDQIILGQTLPALRGLTYGVLPLLLYFTLRRYLQAAHHARPIAFALVSANLINAGADWVLIYGHTWQLAGHTLAIPAFGVTGSAWATSFARVYLMLVLAIAVWRADRRHSYGLLGTSLRIEWQHLHRAFLLGAPAGAQIFVEIAIFATVTALIATMGPLPLAGHEVALQCASTTFMVPMAISTATSVRVGHAIGRVRARLGTIAAVSAAGWSGIAAGAAFMLVMSVVLLSIPAHIARLFTPDAGVIAAAVPLLLVAAGFQFFDGVQITVTGALRGAGNTVAPLLTHLVCYWAVGMPLGYVLAFKAHMGAAGLWWGLLAGLVGAGAVMLTVWFRTSRAFGRTLAAVPANPV